MHVQDLICGTLPACTDLGVLKLVGEVADSVEGPKTQQRVAVSSMRTTGSPYSGEVYVTTSTSTYSPHRSPTRQKEKTGNDTTSATPGPQLK